MEIRNIAIIAHVDHGKTTLTDALMRQTGVLKEGMSMDSNALEQERGITIYAKNSAIFYKDTKINILDTPGHADFGSEVERVLRSIDSVLLLVDAQEGPMPQTRFVLKKSLELGLRPIVVINKIDKPAANPKKTSEQVYELFLDLGANDEQLDFPIVYAIGRDGVAKLRPEDESKDLSPLLDTILRSVPSASGNTSGPLLAQPFNLAYDNFLGRLGVARVYQGAIKANDMVSVHKADGTVYQGKITKLFTFEGLSRKETEEASTGDIVLIAGLPDIYIGETIGTDPNQKPLPPISVDEPTISLNFLVNNSPFAGREGEFVTSRQIRERLEKEAEVNVGLRIDLGATDHFKVQGRGELHIAILLETIRREGYELQVSQPQVITKEVDGVLSEPYEEVVIDVPLAFQGPVMEKMGMRGARMTDMRQEQNSVRIIFEGPTRGLFGYRSEFVIDTKGEGIYASRVIGFRKYAGSIARHHFGSMVSMATGKALGYSLANLQERGTLYIEPATEVYEGMVIGRTSKGEDMSVNPIKGKHLTNMRASGSDEAIQLEPPLPMTIERGLEVMADDEYLEITPKSTRLRKQHLTEIDRIRTKRQSKDS
ncbi:MAG: translational GTPase TypA [Candidatus Yanofskybacteria bacterium]|nr:translational GTPase TypA [Candidatus Yanofskybacteria bacterium]